MRHLPLLLFLFLSSFVSAQCFISVSFLESDCTDDGNSFFVNFTVDGGGDALWTSPTLGIEGAYNTGDVFRAGPFPNDAFETILFQDSEIGACFNVYDTPLPDCPAPGCENFAISASADDVTFCETGEVWSFNHNSDQFPINLRVLNTFGEVVFQTEFDSPNGFSTFLDEGAYSVIMTDEAGCTATTVIEVEAHNCASINGFSWRDSDADGIQDPNENGLGNFLFELLDEAGNVVDTVTASHSGQFFFSSLLPGTYSVRANPYLGLNSTLLSQGDDECLDNDFEEGTFSTAPFSLDGDRITCIDAGWVRTATITGRSWRDDNGDGIRTSNERSQVGSAVFLLKDGNVISSTGTDATGNYRFDDLTPGTGYAIRFSLPETRTAVTPNSAGNLQCSDSDIDVNTLTTPEIEITAGQLVGCVDAGWEPLPCELFEIFIFNEGEDIAPCSPDVFLIVSVGNSVSFPIFVEIVDTSTQEVTLLDTITNSNGAWYADLPSAVYRFTVTNEEGCSVTQVISGERGEGCGSFFGQSWRDDNEDGIFDEVNTPLFTQVELLSNGTVIQETQTSWNGFYGFHNLPVGEYQISFVSPDGFTPTIEDANGGFNDSNIDPATNLTDILTVPPGGIADTLNAGWVRTFACSEFELTAGLSPDHQGCSLLGEYVASVAVASQPVDYYLVNPFNFDTLETISLSDPGAVASFSITTPGSYRIVARDASGCSDEYSFSAFRRTGIPVRIEQSGSACTSEEEVVLTAVAFSESANLSYSWSNGATTPSITGVQVGETYNVFVIDEVTNCSGQQQYTVTGGLPAGLDTVALSGPYIIGCGQDSVLIEPDTVLAGFTYRWFGPFNTIYEGPAFYATFAGTFALEAFNENGCLISGRAQVENLSLEGQFLELFEWSRDSVCNNVICIGLESSVNFGDDSPFSILWEGPDETFNEWANGNPFNNFCGVGPGLYRATITSECDTVRRSLFIEDPLECSSISGTLWVDQAADCDLDPEDTRVPRYVVTLTNQDSGEMFYAMTDMAGNWTASVPLGVYVIEPSLDPLSPFGVCPAVNVTLGNSPITGIQLFLPAENACAQLSTTATMPFLRRCFSNQAFVQYENRGSITAVDAELVVVLDEFFLNVVPNRAFTSRDGNTFTFDLGDLDPFETGTIRFNFVISCEATLGQSHCIEANIKPDEPCNPDENWAGALVQVDALGCDGDSVRFHISNIGNDQMSIPLTYIIIEDGIMLSPDPFVNGFLLPQESMPITLPSNGSTYQVLTNQEPNAPGSDDPTAVVEGCNTNGDPFSTGFTNILPLNNGALTSTTVCRENVGAYDPNDKTGYPLGFGDDNGINPGTRLDYAIRFQNTGTDTAFTVIIRDTLPLELDLATLKLDAASHDFSATLDSNRVLTFLFENIMLPDSSVNLVESQGVVQFSVDHDPTLLPGAIIRNEAAIYFDFNEPIITNKTRHVITKDGLPVSTRAELAQLVSLKVFPNPTNGVLNVRIPLEDVGQEDQLQVTDLYGRMLAATTYAQASAGWNLSHLPAGYYLVVVTDAAGRPRGRTGFVVAK